MLNAFEHADLPFERLVSELEIPRSPDHAPLFQVLFVWQQALAQAPVLGDLSVTPLALEQRSAKFDLSLFLSEQDSQDGGIAGVLEYNSELFKAASIQRLIAHLQVLLAALADDPGLPVRTLPLLTSAEQTQLRAWQQGPALPISEHCLHQLFELQVARTPQAVALLDSDGKAFSYQELNLHANRLAHYLQAQGIGPDAIVALCLERSVDLIISILAILKAGGAYLPLDASYPPERLAYMLDNAGAVRILTQRELASRLPTHGPTLEYLEELWPHLPQAVSNPPHSTTPEHLLYVLYTSGSTGRPKAVAMPHRALVNLLQWQISNEADRGVGPLRTLQITSVCS